MASDLKSKNVQAVKDENATKIQKQIEEDFATALVYFAKGKLDPNQAKEMVTEVLGQVDIKNRELAHKGVNWLAKETLRRKHLI